MSFTKTLPLLTLLLALCCWACGEEATPHDDPDHDHNPLPTSSRHPLADQVEGTYILQTVGASEGEFPIVGRTKSFMKGYSLATIKQEGEGFVITEKACHFEMSGTEATKPTVSDAVPLSLDPVIAAITFEEAADGTLTYHREETTRLIGVNLDNPATDPLPTEAYDERIFDQEGDGKPGATASIAGGIDGGQMLSGEVYFIQRQRFSYSGTQGPDGKMHGLLVDLSNQQVIDATNDILKLEVTNSEVLVDECIATLIPIDETYDCARISYEADTFFPAPVADAE